MTILFSGAFNPHFEALPEYLIAAFRRLGHRVETFDHRGYLLPGRVRRRVSALDRIDRSLLNRRFLRRVRAVRPDLVVVNQGTALAPSSLRVARDLGARCVNWFSDYPLEFEEGLALAPSYDAFFSGSSHAAGRIRGAGHRHAGWLPFACDPAVHRPEEPGSGTRAPFVAFVGSHYPERQILLRHLRGLPVEIWGPGWARAAGDPHIAPMIRGDALRPSRWRTLFSRASGVLNIHYGSFGPREVSGDLANTRVFEILGCGALQIVDRQGDVLRLFREGTHLWAFSSGDELRSRVEAALRDEAGGRAVAARGREEVLARHTYEHRARLLADPAFTGFAVDPEQPASVRLAGGGRA